MLIVITFDYENWNSLLLKATQHGHRVICCLRFYVPAVEEITRYNHEIYAPSDGVTLDHFSPGSKEIARPVGQVISFDAEVNISYVKKPCHIKNQISERFSALQTTTVSDRL